MNDLATAVMFTITGVVLLMVALTIHQQDKRVERLSRDVKELRDALFGPEVDAE